MQTNPNIDLQKKLKICIIGNGGREHAIAHKIKNETSQPSNPSFGSALYMWPQNPMCTDFCQTIDAKEQQPPEDAAQLAELLERNSIDLVIVGPEKWIASGLKNHLQKRKIKCFSPTKEAGQLESSKSFAKSVMKRANIPTAEFRLTKNYDETIEWAKKFLSEDKKVVLKVDGLAAGKGVFVCSSKESITDAIETIVTDLKLDSPKILVERFLTGREFSYFCFVGPSTLTRLGCAVDFKRLRDNDQGPNTGGMGCYSPVPWLSSEDTRFVEDKICLPLATEMRQQNIPYTGWLYVGCMIDQGAISVVEFNCRLGDPEAQVLSESSPLPWLEIILNSCSSEEREAGLNDEYHPSELKFDAREIPQDKSAVAVVLASSMYPYHKQEKPFEPIDLSFLRSLENDTTKIFAAAIKPNPKNQNEIIPKDGRVFTITSSATQLDDARSRVYRSIPKIKTHWDNFQHRTDIASRLD